MTKPFQPLLKHSKRWRRPLLWAALVGLLLIAQSLLVILTLNYESARAQAQVEQAAAEVVAGVRQTASHYLQTLQALMWLPDSDPKLWPAQAGILLRETRPLLRIERRGPNMTMQDAVDSPYSQPVFTLLSRKDIDADAELTCIAAQRQNAPLYSRSYFIPLSGGQGLEVADLCFPQTRAGQLTGYMVATVGLRMLLEEAITTDHALGDEFSFVGGDGTRLARAGVTRGAGVYVVERVVDLPGLTLQLHANSNAGHPKLIPNLTTALVMGLSLALFTVVLVLARDVRRRAQVEAALAESLAFRKAMEDSLITGLRARDISGNITYVNPAFCAMVGFTVEELLGSAEPPYWPPEHVAAFELRNQDLKQRLERPGDPPQGFETEFMRKNGERFPVLIFEAPLRDPHGGHTGWMSAVLDVSAQRRVEELSRQQQDRLQATARLATMGEMASLLSHELNQPLAAIASYATGSLNLIKRQEKEPLTPQMLQQALTRIAEQAERAGRVIKSVHDFVRRREHTREAIGANQLLDAVLPLIRLQARKSGTRLVIDLPTSIPRVRCDLTMVEQVLLNLTRNGIQAMDNGTALSERVLTLAVRQSGDWVCFSVSDRGPGISAEVAQQLFTPFFTTRSEGMGLGLSLCRTVIEQHGGVLDFESHTLSDGGEVTGTVFRFTLPVDAKRNVKPAIHEDRP